MVSDILIKSCVVFESSLASLTFTGSHLHSPVSLVSARHRCPLLCTWVQRTRSPSNQQCDTPSQTGLCLSTSPEKNSEWEGDQWVKMLVYRFWLVWLLFRPVVFKVAPKGPWGSQEKGGIIYFHYNSIHK